ncbi:YbaB/EbfC family nucleoid-associated protein [Solwaraspora sp. WMMD1047]|uniref:YbaB/EbfC family nucleoid-associated protein n=1 Tax=Solwaraspora sp. WMMD1047 TaxID=3016102 RepID=UPI002415D283|nr:YbaB/EbfC family nucleoid-associated protein [Solwaraspora sp. WMMD1047]MDG4829216.1 YbaB/EbfC family nucleoid-associated protein [Solwaraspora sp. WMMD1047]
MSDPTNPGAGTSLSSLLRQMQDQFDRSERLNSQLSELVGRAVSPDGMVRVACTADDPTHEVEIDPRALRRGATDLAGSLQEAARGARADLARQTDDLIREQTGGGGPLALPHDPAAAQQKLRHLNDLINSGARDTNLMFERMRRQFGL